MRKNCMTMPITRHNQHELSPHDCITQHFGQAGFAIILLRAFQDACLSTIQLVILNIVGIRDSHSLVIGFPIQPFKFIKTFLCSDMRARRLGILSSRVVYKSC